jgi:5-formyltetrahydrofolate cyclo-ligase
MRPAQGKAALRREALALRADVDPKTREDFAASLATRGIEIARRCGAQRVSAYWPMRDEADTRFLLQALAYHEFTTCLPAVVGRGRPLVFRRWKSGDPMVQGGMGIFEPSAAAPEVEPGLLFVPLAAFDRRGQRLGYGAGHFDRTLSWLRIRSPVIAVGVGFACQEVAAIPEEEHDQPLDFIITEAEVIRRPAVGVAV